MNDNSHNNRGGHNSQAPDSLNLALPDLAASPEGNLWNSAIGRRTFLKKTGAATVATAVAMHGFRVQVQATVTGQDFTYSATGTDNGLTVGGREVEVKHTWANGPGTGQYRFIYEKLVGENWVVCGKDGGDPPTTDAGKAWTDKSCTTASGTNVSETAYTGAVGTGVRVKSVEGRVKP